MNSKEIRGLVEAYSEVYYSQELDEAREASHDPEGYEERQRRSDRRSSRERRMNDPHTGINSPAFHEFMKQQMGGKKKIKEDADLFDIILEYLVAEGYADTNENALIIMANMSEEWRQDIMEISQKTATKAFATRATGEFEYDTNPSDRTKSGKSKADESKRRIVKKFGAKAGEHAEKAAEVQIFGRKDASGRRKQSPQPRIQTSDHENQREFKRELRIRRDRRLRAARAEDTED